MFGDRAPPGIGDIPQPAPYLARRRGRPYSRTSATIAANSSAR